MFADAGVQLRPFQEPGFDPVSSALRPVFLLSASMASSTASAAAQARELPARQRATERPMLGGLHHIGATSHGRQWERLPASGTSR